MQLEFIDWALVFAFFAIALIIGAVVSKRAGQNASEFFLSGRNMPWWLLGFSMVATTFAADTPLLVTDIVRKNGVMGNWVWWAFLLTGMLTVFVYAKLWRRSGVLTDLEFYEIRYSGAPAALLRGFRALYLGVFFNVLVMANVTLAAIKIGEIMLGLSPMQTILIASSVAVCFSAMGGLRGVMLTDCLLFVVAMIGSFGAAYVALDHPQVGGLSGLLTHENVADKLRMVPSFDFSGDDGTKWDHVLAIFILPLAVQWWSVWYPGAEPGGGGYIAQRMLAAKNEKHATGATLFFNVAHYALRPWPWIIVALASLIVFPDVDAIREAFPDVAAAEAVAGEKPTDKINDDSAYPAMLTFLPTGLRGLVVASLIAAYMSTISTHLNWGSSYVVNDFWKRFWRPEAGDRELVRVGRISTVVMMAVAAYVALQLLENALQGFEILLQIGAGTGLLFILRWFWWRINPYSELTAMIVSFGIAIAFAKIPEKDLLEAINLISGVELETLSTSMKLVLGVGITTVAWLIATFVAPADDDEKLISFYKLTRPGGPGWRPIIERAKAQGVDLGGGGEASGIAIGIACMVAGCFAVYSSLFATGYWLYGEYLPAGVLTAVAVIAFVFLASMWNKVHAD